MLVLQKIGNLESFQVNGRSIDQLSLEWFETSKRILHKRTRSGREITCKFLKESQHLTEGDIIYFDDLIVVVIEVLPCDAILIRPKTMEEMASVCYEIGNKHLPLFIDGDELATPYDAPLLRLLIAAGYDVKQGETKLIHPLRSTVAPHSHNNGNGSLFSKIMKLTTPDE